MECSFRPTNTEVLHVFTDVVEGAGGNVAQDGCDWDFLYLRATLPDLAEVQPGDPVRRGVALTALNEYVCVSPYVFRVVCSNGQIMPEDVKDCSLRRMDADSPVAEVTEWTLKFEEVIRACLEPEIFTGAVERMRAASKILVRTWREALRHSLPGRVELPGLALEEAECRFDEGDDQSLYGMVNAITSTARDEEDPELRWRLEELGGGVLALVDSPLIKTDSAAAQPVMT